MVSNVGIFERIQWRTKIHNSINCLRIWYDIYQVASKNMMFLMFMFWKRCYANEKAINFLQFKASPIVVQRINIDGCFYFCHKNNKPEHFFPVFFFRKQNTKSCDIKKKPATSGRIGMDKLVNSIKMFWWWYWWRGREKSIIRMKMKTN